MVNLNTEFYYLDIGITSWDMHTSLSRILLDTFYKDFTPISRSPYEMIFRLIDGMCTFTISRALFYQIVARLDCHYITRQESGVLCGSINLRKTTQHGHNKASSPLFPEPKMDLRLYA